MATCGGKPAVASAGKRCGSGSEYAWANAKRLQAALAEAGLEYVHMKELAPTTDMREAQYREDARRGEGKRSRTKLAPIYRRLYTEQILDPADLSPLVAERLHREEGVGVPHLEP